MPCPDRASHCSFSVDALAHPKQAEALLETPALAGSPVEVPLVGSVRGLVSLNASPTRRVIDADGVLADRFAAESFPLYLVRPDEHVAARLRDAEPEAVAAALGVALGRLPRGRLHQPGVSARATPNSRGPMLRRTARTATVGKRSARPGSSASSRRSARA